MKIIKLILIIKLTCSAACFSCPKALSEDPEISNPSDIVKSIENTIKFGQGFKEIEEVLKKMGLKVVKSPSLSSPDLMKQLGMIGEGGLKESEIAAFAVTFSETLGVCLWFNKDGIFISYDKTINLDQKNKGKSISEVLSLQSTSKE
jgi:hypothetical protein